MVEADLVAERDQFADAFAVDRHERIDRQDAARGFFSDGPRRS